MSSSSILARIVPALLACLTLLGQAAASQTLQPKEALQLAFPQATIERCSITLDKKQRARVEELAGHKLASARVRPYRAMLDGKCVGTAYFDTRKVRTKAQTLMIALDAAGKVKRIEVLRFDEPREYRAPAKWMAQFPGKSLSGTLKIKGEIRNLTGATLTARATLDAVREALAVHQVLEAERAKKAKEREERKKRKEETEDPQP
ncbi:MAG: FMN-binding protein [Planctomycetes bacterium]|nr:FMN-binding protein [Planctomycetota bacterium]